jgi:flagellar protein FlaG
MLIQNTSNLPVGPQPEPLPKVRDGTSEPAVNVVEKSANGRTQAPVELPRPELTTTQPTAEQLNKAVEAINRVLRQSNQNLQFSVDDTTSKLIVKVVDTSTGELIRQVPSDVALAIAQSIDQFQASHKIKLGALLKQTA